MGGFNMYNMVNRKLEMQMRVVELELKEKLKLPKKKKSGPSASEVREARKMAAGFRAGKKKNDPRGKESEYLDYRNPEMDEEEMEDIPKSFQSDMRNQEAVSRRGDVSVNMETGSDGDAVFPEEEKAAGPAAQNSHLTGRQNPETDLLQEIQKMVAASDRTELQKAVLWSEILGEPVVKRRRRNGN